MKIKKLKIIDFCGFSATEIDFRDFSILIGPNGIGKTTILNAISLLTSQLSFPDQSRLKSFLRKNIRNIDEQGAAKGFRLESVFEHEGKELNVVLTENGFEKNEVVEQPWYWYGVTYFAKFDSEMVHFQLRENAWPMFSEAFEAITGWPVEPDILYETRLKENIVVGFFMQKPGSRVSSRKASAGEKKIAKSLSQIFNLEDNRQPDIILVDNLEMHAHYKRHIKMFEKLRELFAHKQVISTTHSLSVIENYQPREDVMDVEQKMIEGIIFKGE